MAVQPTDAGFVRIRAERLKDFCSRVLVSVDLPAEHAEIIADAMVEGDLRGIHTHGAGVLPRYVRGILAGQLNRRPSLRVVRERGATAVLDADNGMGQVGGARAMEIAIQKASQHGVGMVAVRNSNHYGAASYFAMMALPHGMIGYTTTNGPSAMAPWGGRSPVLANNPLCYAIPAGEGEIPIVLDMACSVTALAKIRAIAVEGGKIPFGWATDAEGRPTEDAREAMKGSLLPIGGPKGYGLALVNEVLSGALSAALTTVEISRAVIQDGSIYVSQRIGHLMVAIDVDAFLPRSEFEERVRRVVASVRAAEPAAGASRIRLPGERALECRRRYLQDGVPLPTAAAGRLGDLSRETGIPLPLEG